MPTTGKTNPLRKLRQRLKLNQLDFWSRLGITQSGGSRFECGRRISKPVQSLLIVAYGTDKKSLNEIKRLRHGN